jgi:MoxR-like ATPase
VEVADLAVTFEAVLSNVRSAYVGSEDTVRLALCALMAGGHVLVEDYPGVGKTTLAKALARSLGLHFGRVQFTADLLPADITGAVVVDQHSRELGFRAGPVFTNVLLADELNRASPKAQSALLEAMEERQVSVDGTSHRLPVPFMVVATQNPHDTAGTFPLPHSQLDRFLLRLALGYPDRHGEDELLAAADTRPLPEDLPEAASASYVLAFAAMAAGLHVAAAVRSYILDLVEATRRHAGLEVGASPRAGLALLRAARALALSDGRGYVLPDDVKRVAVAALAHRVVVRPSAGPPGTEGAAAVVGEILGRLPVPVDIGHR